MGRPLFTKIDIEHAPFDIKHETPTIMIGSCFSDNIGSILSTNKFNVLKNPLGILYNPASISKSLNRCLQNAPVYARKLSFNNGLWHSFDFHGSFSQSTPDDVEQKTNASIQQTHDFLKQAKVLFVTFGTAWIYRLKETGEIAANCHKFPSSYFIRERLSIDKIVDDWTERLKQIWSFNNKLKIVFTVSPVKHLKDGAHENQLSKSTLLLAIDELTKHNPEHASYFPSYEIVNDELRDYRFYAGDMSHLSETAVQIIFDKFQETYFTTPTLQLINEIEKINKAVSHKILHANTGDVNKFALAALKRIEKIENTHPFLNLQTEKNYFLQLVK